MKKFLILCAVLITAWSINTGAQPQQQAEVVSKADKTTVEFVVRDSKPILMDIYQFKDQKTEGKRPVFIYSFGGAWAMGSRVDALCNPCMTTFAKKVGSVSRSTIVSAPLATGTETVSSLPEDTILSNIRSTSVLKISMPLLHGLSSMLTNTTSIPRRLSSAAAARVPSTV